MNRNEQRAGPGVGSFESGRRTRGARAAISVSVVLGLVAAGVTHAEPALAYGPLELSDVGFGVEEVWTWSEDAAIVFSETPTFGVQVYDTVEPADEYEFDLQVRDDTLATVASEHFNSETSHDGDWWFSQGSWTAGPAVFSFGDRYTARYRVIAGDNATVWSDWENFDFLAPPTTPLVVGPADNAILLTTPVLSVLTDVEPQGYSIPAVSYRIETSWEGGAPIVVGELSDYLWNGRQSSTVSVPDLPDGLYRWQAVVAYNGMSEWTEYRTFRKVSPPSEPRSFVASANGRHGIQATWLPPLSQTDGFEIGSYEVSLDATSMSEVVSSSANLSASFDGLPFGTYTVRIRSVSELGTSSEQTQQITLGPSEPSVPLAITTAVVGDKIQLSWSPPADDGESPLTGYAVSMREWSTGAFSYQTLTDESIEFDAFPGADFLFLVNASNALGTSAWGGVRHLITAPPSEPQDLVAHIGDEFVDLQWTPPARINGAATDSYTITASPGGAVRTVPGGFSGGSVRFSDLDNDTQYTFDVRAENTEGLGAEAVIAATPRGGSTDSDQDGLTDATELRVGTEVLLTDTDSDGIDDFSEVTKLIGVMNPLLADSDYDSVGDADEDSDGDGTTNGAELLAGTNALDPDTDRDGLLDPSEVETSPTSSDTDADEVPDGLESQLGLDPTLADSNSDSIPDNEEQVELTLAAELEAPQPYVENLAQTAVASVSGPASDVAIVAPPTVGRADELPGVLTAMASVSGPAGVQLQSLALSYSAGVSSARLDRLGVMKWDEPASSWEVTSLSLSVSTSARTISILSPALGVTYAVVDLGEWRAHAQQCDLAFDGRAPLDVELIFDETSSVRQNDPTGERFNAVNEVLNTLRAGDQVNLRGVGVVWVGASGGGGFPVMERDLNYWGFSTTTSDEDIARDLNITSVDAAKFLLDVRSVVPYYDSGYGGGNPDDDSNEYLPQNNMGEQMWGSSAPREVDEVNPYVESAEAYSCRQPAIILLTDGELKPDDAIVEDDYPAGYVPFRDRTDIPVHVLDVGDGDEDHSEWLIDLADTSGGSYSYVPTAMDVGAWVNSNMPEGTFNGDPILDTDSDGVSDWVETHGVVNTNVEGSRRFFTDPLKADTDDDGVPDGIELGRKVVGTTEGITWNTTAPIVAFEVKSNPQWHDGDGDGLYDGEEIELGSPALNSDFDRDLLDDGDEFAAGGNVYSSNTDNDPWSDKLEFDLLAQGFDLTVPNPKVTAETYLHDFYLGFWCGDMGPACASSSPAWLLGNLLSGYLIFGDLRDFVANLGHGNFVMAAAIAVGAMPLFGDIEATIAKVVKRATDVGASSATRWASIRILDQSSISDVRFVDELTRISPSLVAWLKSSNMADGDLRRLVSRNGPENLDRLRNFPGSQIADANAGFALTGTAGEDVVRSTLGSSVSTHDCLRYANATPCVRFADVMVGGVQGAQHETKVGWVTSQRISNQLAVDRELIRLQRITSVTYHFVASDLTGRIGATQGVLSAIATMKSAYPTSVNIVIHLP